MSNRDFTGSLAYRQAEELAEINRADAWLAPGYPDLPLVSTYDPAFEAPAGPHATVEHRANLVTVNVASDAEAEAGTLSHVGASFLLSFQDETNRRITQVALTDDVAEWLVETLASGLRQRRGDSGA